MNKLLVYVSVLLVAGAALATAHSLVKRQANTASSPRPNEPAAAANRRPAMSADFEGDAMAGAMATSMAASSQTDRPDGRRPAARPQAARPSVQRPQASSRPPVDAMEDMEPPTRRRRPPARNRPAVASSAAAYGDSEYDGDEADCVDDDEGADYYGHNPFRMASSGLRRMSNMMGNMFEQMQGLASGDYADYGPGGRGGNYAVASSSSDTDGYSKMSSIVNSNGRTRGLVTETRNGRTKTRRIGGDDEADDDNE